MQNKFHIAFTTLMVLSASAAAAQQGPAAAVDAFHAALKRGDSKAVTALLAPDALIFEAGHIERSAAEYAGGHLAGDAAHAAKTVTVPVARQCLITPAQAVIMSESTTTADGRADPRIGTDTMVLTKLSEGWQIAHIHWSSRKLPTGAALPKRREIAADCN